MAQSVGLGIQMPDFGRSLAQGMQLRAAGEERQANNLLRQMMAEPGVAQGLLAGDPNALALLAGLGPGGFQIAAPLMAQAQQRQERNAERAEDREFRERQLAENVRLRNAQLATSQAGSWSVMQGGDGRYYRVNSRTGEAVPLNVPTPGREALAPPSGYVWGPPGPDGAPTLRPIPGGPAEYITQQVVLPDGTIGTVQIPRAPPQRAAPDASQAASGTSAPPNASPAQAATPAPAQAMPSAEGLGLPSGSRVLTVGPGRQAGLTETQAKANLFGRQMENAENILAGTQIPSFGMQTAWRNLAEGVVNPLMSGNDQKYFNAVRLFAAGVLRKETGAAFTASELRDVQSRFFPMPGDGPEVVAQKARARTEAINSIRAELPGQVFRGGEETGAQSSAPESGNVPPPPPGFEIVR